jgi:starch phosphorylase
MADLAVVGSHAVNGVAATHSQLIKTSLMPDLHSVWPGKFQNKTSGVTPRRWLLGANPELSALITRAIGDGWPAKLDELRRLDELAHDRELQGAFRSVKEMKKAQLARTIVETTGITVDPLSLFDVQAKRVDECTRQLLNAMHIIDRYLAIADEGAELPSRRTFIFAGKAAPGDAMARLIVRLINGIAEVVNGDARAREQMQVVFLPDYRVSLAEQIIPAADLSEQISTAGTEASGVGGMKFALNGALTVGTRDGVNVEIAEQVGESNIYLFGRTVAENERLRRDGYDPCALYRGSARLETILDAIGGGRFSRGDTRMFTPIVSRLVYEGDDYLHLADFKSYAHGQERVGRDFADREAWTRRAIHNTARAGYFSSDRAVREYARDIWRVEAV